MSLIEFAKEMCRAGFDGADLSGFDILQAAERLGLVESVAYDPEKHPDITGSEYLDPGDRIYIFTAALSSVQPVPVKMLVRARDWMADNICEGDAEGMAALGALALYLNDLPTPQPVERPSEPVASIYEAAKAVARYRGEIAQVEAKLHGRQDYRFYMEPVDATLDEAVQAVEDSARFATPPSPAKGAEPVAFIVERLDGSKRYVVLAESYDPRESIYWVNEKRRAEHRVTPLFTSPPVDSDALKAQREALEFYASPDKYISKPHPSGYADCAQDILGDAGATARAALSSQGSRS